MSILNRTDDPSQQRQVLPFSFGTNAISSGETGPLAFVPYPCLLELGNMSVGYMAGTSFYLLLQIQRFIPGTGMTYINLGSTFVPTVMGTSGFIGGATTGGASGFTFGSTTYLMANDVIGYLASGGATAEINNICGLFIVRPTQDIRRFFGL